MFASSSSGFSSQFASMPSRMGELLSPKALSPDPSHGSALEPQVDGGVVGGGGLGVLDQRFDHAVAQPVNVHRLPVVAPPVRVVLIKKFLNLGVGHRPAEIHDRVPKLAQGL